MPYEWNFSVVLESTPVLLKGLEMTIFLTATTMIAGLILGLLVSLARLSSFNLLNMPAQAYTEFFRSTPLLVQLLWFYYSLPIITGITFSSEVTAFIGLTLNLGAFIAEIFRAGIVSIGKDQIEAAAAIGMSHYQTMRRIILPQAVRRIIPPLGSTWVSLFKDTSLVSTIAVSELMYKGSVLSIQTYRPVEIYTVIAVIYFFTSYPQARLVDYLFSRFRVRD